MKILVCVKSAPDTSEVEISIEEGGLAVDRSRFSFDINDADNYALEEAVLLKEELGGEVLVLSMGPQEIDIILRTCMAKGADGAIRVEDERIYRHNPLFVAKALSKAVEGEGSFDLILTGCMSSDEGQMTIGVALASFLEIPHASMVKHLEVLEKGELRVSRELEGGLMEVVDIKPPALLTIQTGINEPRYASIRGIRQARNKELLVKSLDDLGMDPREVDEEASPIFLTQLSIPEVLSAAEFIEGDANEKAQRLLSILKEEGLI